jgi:hypothetical protein
MPLFSGGHFRIVIRKRTLKIRTRSILFRIARRFQRNKVRIFISFRPRDIHDWKSWNIKKSRSVPSVSIAFCRIFGLKKKLINRKCRPFLRLCKSKKGFAKYLKIPEISRFSWEPHLHQNFWHFIRRCRLTYICLSPPSRPFRIISLLPFFLPINFLMYRYASRVASIRLDLAIFDSRRRILQYMRIMIGEIANSFLNWLIQKLNVSAFSVKSYERNTK